MDKHDGTNGRRVGKASPWILGLSIMTSVTTIAVGMAVASNGTEKAIAYVVGLVVGSIVCVIGLLLTFKPQ